MAVKNLFTPEEWRHVLLLPLIVYRQVAGADGRIDAAEGDRLTCDLLDADELAEPLMREIFQDLRDSDVEGLLPLADPALIPELRVTLERQVSGQRYHQFIKALLVWGMSIAQASGGFLGLFGSKVSPEELGALQELADAFELDPSVWS